MNRSVILDCLRAAESSLRLKGVGALYLFGSSARDEARPDSDIDLFVDAAGDDFYDLANFTGAYRCIREIFPGVAIGYSTRDGLSKYIRATVEREAIKVF